MATLILGAVGTLVGGPLGGAIGALAGRSVDAMILGSPKREGARLKDLAISTSSYGQPIPALYGAVRSPGTVIWSTDLKEHSETSGGGKGKPELTSYTYTVSLAVALSSRPIDRVGRIWADGNLLRGSAGDLKTGGTIRTYAGHADQLPDPLMAADIGPSCPAHRGCAYVVFEDLALADFGNRIPALSFEIFSGSARTIVSDIASERGIASHNTEFAELEGFVFEGGSIANLLTLVDRLHSVGTSATDGKLALRGLGAGEQTYPVLPEPVSFEEGEFGRDSGEALARKSTSQRALSALRYYDPSRDYQPGLQRAEGASGDSAGTRRTLEFPGVFAAAAARGLLARAAARDEQRGEALAWRTGELDPGIGPGSIVRAPGLSGLWRIDGWEWRERGVELELVRHVPPIDTASVADAGTAWSPRDRLASETTLRAFELPWDGVGDDGTPQRYAAVSAASGRWPGAAIYRSLGDTLVPVANSGSARAVAGTLVEPLAGSSALRFEPAATIRIQLVDADALLEPAGIDELAFGANRLLVGGEIIQFASCEPEGGGVWRLAGLLRGRGGTEVEAASGHPVAAPATLLDERLVPLPPGLSAGETISAIGIAEQQPITAILEGAGRTRTPLSPVHPRSFTDADGRLHLAWTRRARGGWAWLAQVEQPLVEQAELYEIGVGDLSSPVRTWTATMPALILDQAELDALKAASSGAPIWVRQKGSYAVSAPLLLTTLPQD